MASFEKPISIDLGENPATIVFHALNEVEDFIAKEVRFWRKLHKGDKVGADVQGVLSSYINWLNQFVTDISNHKTSPDDIKREYWVSKLEEWTEPFKDWKIIHSASAAGKYLIEIRERDSADQAVRVAACICYTFATSMDPQNIVGWMEAYDLATQFEKGERPEQIGPREAHLRGFKIRWEHEFGEVRTRGQALNSQLDEHVRAALEARRKLEEKDVNLQADFDRLWADLRASTDEKINAAVSNLEAAKRDAADDIERYKLTIKNDIALSGPNTYWDSKRKFHEEQAEKNWVSFVSTMKWSFVAFSGYVTFLVILVLAGVVKIEFDSSSFAKIYSAALPLVLLGFGAFWLARLFSRKHLLHIGLMHDAHERTACVQTYLALSENRSIELKDPDRAIILGALFRAAAAGGVDDAAPPTIIEAVLSSYSKKPGPP